jgi:hypothetical protein
MSFNASFLPLPPRLPLLSRSQRRREITTCRNAHPGRMETDYTVLLDLEPNIPTMPAITKIAPTTRTI